MGGQIFAECRSERCIVTKFVQRLCLPGEGKKKESSVYEEIKKSYFGTAMSSSKNVHGLALVSGAKIETVSQ